MRVTTEEIDQPVLNIVWHAQLGQLLQEGGMPHRVRRFAEVKGDDDNIGVREEHVGDDAEEGDDCNGRGASR